MKQRIWNKIWNLEGFASISCSPKHQNTPQLFKVFLNPAREGGSQCPRKLLKLLGFWVRLQAASDQDASSKSQSSWTPRHAAYPRSVGSIASGPTNKESRDVSPCSLQAWITCEACSNFSTRSWPYSCAVDLQNTGDLAFSEKWEICCFFFGVCARLLFWKHCVSVYPRGSKHFAASVGASSTVWALDVSEMHLPKLYTILWPLRYSEVVFSVHAIKHRHWTTCSACLVTFPRSSAARDDHWTRGL